MFFSDSDISIIAHGIDVVCDGLALNVGVSSASTIRKMKNLKNRLINKAPSFTSGEIRNVCLSLETLLEAEPMNWAASQLLNRVLADMDSLSR